MRLLGPEMRIGVETDDLRSDAGTQPLGRYDRERTDPRPTFDQRRPKFADGRSDRGYEADPTNYDAVHRRDFASTRDWTARAMSPIVPNATVDLVPCVSVSSRSELSPGLIGTLIPNFSSMS